MKEKFIPFLKFSCFVYLVFLVPRVISIRSSHEKSYSGPRVLLGVENLVSASSGYKNLRKLRFGLICDKQSFDQSGKRTVDLLHEKGFPIKKIFVNEDRRDLITRKVFATKKGRDLQTGAPLYFLRGDAVKFIERNGDGLDAFFVDVQDEGVKPARIRNFLQSLFVFAAQQNKRIVILDRPNILGGIIEGPGDIPWRHGLTIGELAVYINRHVAQNPANLTVIPLKRWRRGTFIANRRGEIGISILLNPLRNIGPFCVVDGDKKNNKILLFRQEEKLSRWETLYLKRLCWNMGLRCVDYFCEAGDGCEQLSGLKLSIKKDIFDFSIFNALMTISRFLKNRKQIQFSLKNQFDDEFGSCDVREFLQGYQAFDTFKESIEASLDDFYDKSKYCCLYKPLPRVVEPKIVTC